MSKKLIDYAEPIDYLEKALNKFLSNPALALWRAIEARLISQIPFKSPVLDLGCGDGSFAELIQKKIDWGVDILSSDVEEAKRKAIYKQVLVADALQLPFEDQKFGTVLSNCVLEHIQDLNGALGEIIRVLRKGGLFVCTVPSDQFGKNLFFASLLGKISSNLVQKYVTKKNTRLNHYHCYSAETWRLKLQGQGINVTEIKSYMPRRAQRIWDLVDEIFVWGFGPFTLQNILIYLEKFISKYYFVRIYYRLLKKSYEHKDNLGGALLIMGVKE